MRKMLANLSNIGDWDLGGEDLVRVKRQCEGMCPRLPYKCKCRLADEDGFAASLLDGFLRGRGELVRVNGDGGLDLSVIEHLEESRSSCAAGRGRRSSRG